MGSHSSKLLDIASAPLSSEAPKLSKELLRCCASQLADEYARLLQRKNGFFAFESALHFLSASKHAKGYDVQSWNDEHGWVAAYGDAVSGCLFFAEDVFGEQFVLKDGAVHRFDPETAKFTAVADSLDEWARVILEDYRTETGYEVAHAWQTQHGPLGLHQRLVPKTPFILGGDYAVDNVMALDAKKGMELRADIWRQIKDLPPGAKVEIRLTE